MVRIQYRVCAFLNHQFLQVQREVLHKNALASLGLRRNEFLQFLIVHRNKGGLGRLRCIVNDTRVGDVEFWLWLLRGLWWPRWARGLRRLWLLRWLWLLRRLWLLRCLRWLWLLRRLRWLRNTVHLRLAPGASLGHRVRGHRVRGHRVRGHRVRGHSLTRLHAVHFIHRNWFTD